MRGRARAIALADLTPVKQGQTLMNFVRAGRRVTSYPRRFRSVVNPLAGAANSGRRDDQARSRWLASRAGLWDRSFDDCG